MKSENKKRKGGKEERREKWTRKKWR